LYGVYEILRRQQTGQDLKEKIYNPSYECRILNHWDNPDGSIERGYAGLSIFWHKGDNPLVVTKNDKVLWQEYAACQCIYWDKRNCPQQCKFNLLFMLTKEYLQRVKINAEVLRPYGIKTYLSIKFSSPSLLEV